MKLILLLFVAIAYSAVESTIVTAATGRRLYGELCKEVHSIPDEMACDENRGLACVNNKCVCSSTPHYWDVGPTEWVPEEKKCLGSKGYICNLDKVIPYNSTRDDQKCASGYCDRVSSKTVVCNPEFCAEKAVHQCGPPEYKYYNISFSLSLSDLKEICVYAMVYLFFILGGIVTLHIRANTILR